MYTRKLSAIYQSRNIRDILRHCSYNTLLILDLDNTVIEPVQELGSDQWFTCFMEYAIKLTLDKAEAFSLVITIYNAVQQHVRHQTVEANVINLLRTLQAIGIPVLGLTARSDMIAKHTLQQLLDNGIDFSRYWGNAHIKLMQAGDKIAVFNDGIIFCSGLDKGKCYRAFSILHGGTPSDVLMADDKESNLLVVKAAVEAEGSTFVGLRYGFLDEKVAAVDLEKANLELIQISHLLPEAARAAMIKLKISPLRSNSLFTQNAVATQNLISQLTPGLKN
jgi:hypothetical protein